jgi:NTE family protein
MDEANSVSGQALVLGGGGVAGIAWITGVLLGLSDEGVDLYGTSDVLIGTSAGATVAAQVASGTPLDDLFQRQVDAARQVKELAPDPQLLGPMRAALPELFRVSDLVERRLRIGDLAASATTVAEGERRAVIAARLPAHEWPDRLLKIVATDIATGEPRIFDRLSGVDLVDAVAASSAVPGMWPPVTIGEHRYMDGGVSSSDNADLAAGCETIVVISPMGRAGVMLPSSFSLSTQIDELQQLGARIRVIEPDDAARQAIGDNRLSPTARIPAAEAGRAQGRAIGADIAIFISARDAHK